VYRLLAVRGDSLGSGSAPAPDTTYSFKEIPMPIIFVDSERNESTQTQAGNDAGKITQTQDRLPAAAAGSPYTVTMLPVASLVPGEARPEAADVGDLLESFQNAPLLHPLTVRQLADRKFEVIAGHRRLAAARAAGWTEVPCRVLDLDDRSAKIIALEENLRRTPVANALEAQAKLHALYELARPTRHGGDRRSATARAQQQTPTATEQVASLTGTSPRTVQRNKTIAAKAVPEVRQALQTGAINKLTAASIASLPKHEQEAELKAVLDSKSALSNRVNLFVRALRADVGHVEQIAKEGGVDARTWNTLRSAAVELVEAIDRASAANDNGVEDQLADVLDESA
jgi:ParB family chromosome partitioning protein